MDILSFINTPFKQKFGIPRQPLLVMEAFGVMRFPKNDFFVEAFRGIESYSHLWLIFQFHEVSEENIKALVRPPRFEGEKKGVFATRSPHRPNRLGMSVVKFISLEILSSEVVLTVSGVDLLDGTPIFDIKPYLPYVDAVELAQSQDISLPQVFDVHWNCEKVGNAELIEKVLSLDPRASHQKTNDEEFKVLIDDENVCFRIKENIVYILSVSKRYGVPFGS